MMRADVTGDRPSIRISVQRPDARVRIVTLTSPPEATAGAALDRIGEHLGLADAVGGIQGGSLISGTWIDRAEPLSRVGLLRGERIRVGVGLSAPGPTGPFRRWAQYRAGDAEGRVAVNRPPRTFRPKPSVVVRLPSRSVSRAARRFPLGAILIPLLIGGLLIAVTRRWEIALFSLFSPVLIFWNFIEERRARNDELHEYGRTYADEVAAVTARTAAFASEWAQWVRRNHPPPDEVAGIVAQLDTRLWERQPGDPDQFPIRVGTATRTAPATLTEDVGRERDPQVGADCARALVVDHMPALVDLGHEGVLAILGAPGDLDSVAAWVGLQLAALHSPADLAFVAALSDPATRDWWRWLPHVTCARTPAWSRTAQGQAGDPARARHRTRRRSRRNPAARRSRSPPAAGGDSSSALEQQS